MAIQNARADGEAHSAGLRIGLLLFGLKHRSPDFRKFRVRERRGLVPYGELLILGLHNNRAARLSVADGVGDEIVNHHPDKCRIAVRPLIGLHREVNCHPLLCNQIAVGGKRILRQLVPVGPLRPECHRLVHDAGVRKHLLKLCIHGVALAQKNPQIMLLLLGLRSGRQVFRGVSHHRHRRLQLVCHGVDERIAQLFKLPAPSVDAPPNKHCHDGKPLDAQCECKDFPTRLAPDDGSHINQHIVGNRSFVFASVRNLSVPVLVYFIDSHMPVGILRKIIVGAEFPRLCNITSILRRKILPKSHSDNFFVHLRPL